MTARPRRSSAASADASTGPHKTLRKKLIRALAQRPGQPCARCGQPMYVSQLLDLDHTDDRTGYLGLSHRSCNRRAGQVKTVAILRRRGWTPSPRQRQAIAWQQRQAPAPQPMRSARDW
jgi:hypothetical protein